MELIEYEFSLDPHEGAPEDLAHSELGASGAERWMNCPGSIAMGKDMPNKSSMYAMEGTAAHHLGELCLLQSLSADVFEGKFMTYSGSLIDDQPDLDGRPTVRYEGELYDAEDPAFEIDEEMIKAVNLYLSTVYMRMDHARAIYKEDPQLLVENKFDLSSIHPGMFGRNDVSLFIPQTFLDALDYKHGRKAVAIEDNRQLKYYALGALLNLCQDEFDMPKIVSTGVIQPRVAHRDGPVRWADYPSTELAVNFRRDLKLAAVATEQPNAELVEGPWCFFCKGKVKCPKITGKFAELTKVDMYDLTDEELTMVPDKTVKQIVQNVTNNPELLARFVNFVPIFESVVKEVQDFALAEALAGKKIAGQKVARRDTKRKFEDKDATAKALLAEGFKPAEIYDLKLKTPAAMKKVSKALEAAAEPYVVKPEGDYILVPITDKREEVAIGDGFDLSETELALIPATGSDTFDIL